MTFYDSPERDIPNSVFRRFPSEFYWMPRVDGLTGMVMCDCILLAEDEFMKEVRKDG